MAIFRDKRGDGQSVVRVDLAPAEENVPELRVISHTVALGEIERMIVEADEQRKQLPPA
jgi:hypothetical protein